MSEIKGKVIAITGASSGIGEATAPFGPKGALLGARRTDRLQENAKFMVGSTVISRIGGVVDVF